MVWHCLETQPLAIDVSCEMDAERALQITAQVARYALPLVIVREGRAEPLATAALYRVAGHVVIVTCRHIFDEDESALQPANGVALGDLAIPLPQLGRLLWLQSLKARVLAHPQQDLALIDLPASRLRQLLLQHWPAVPLNAESLPAIGATAVRHSTSFSNRPCKPQSELFVLAGYPYEQMRRIGLELYARPLVLFSKQHAASVPCAITYAHTARRMDGVDVYSPALDGVSGATLWRVFSEDCANQSIELTPVAVQSAFKHDAYARSTPLDVARDLLAQLAQV